VVHNPLWTLVEETTTRMDEHLLVVGQCFESLRRVLLGCVVEEACAYSFSDFVVLFHVVSATGNNWQLEAIQNH